MSRGNWCSPRAVFPLEEVPPDMYGLITEKMLLDDIRTFSMGSRLSARICEDFRCVESEMKYIEIFPDVEQCKVARRLKRRKWVSLSEVPRKIWLTTEILTLNKKCLNSIRKYRITADLVEFGGNTGMDTDFVKEVIQLTRPGKITFESTSFQVLSLDELKEVKHVTFPPWMNFSDLELLAMNMASFTVERRPQMDLDMTTDGVLRLIEEWVDGRRSIGRIHLPIHNLDERMILQELNGYKEQETNRLVFCKGEGTTELIVDLDRRALTVYERKCQGHP